MIVFKGLFNKYSSFVLLLWFILLEKKLIFLINNEALQLHKKN